MNYTVETYRIAMAQVRAEEVERNSKEEFSNYRFNCLSDYFAGSFIGMSKMDKYRFLLN